MQIHPINCTKLKLKEYRMRVSNLNMLFTLLTNYNNIEF